MIEPTEEWLRRKYEAEGLTMDSIAREIGVSLCWVRRRLIRFGIQIRPIGPAKGKFAPVCPPEPVTGDAEEYVFPLETEAQSAMWRELLSRSHAAGEVA